MAERDSEREAQSLWRRTATELRANRPLGGLGARLRGGAPGVVFVHIPKCGGTSVERALRRRIRLGRRLIGPDASYEAAAALIGAPDDEDHRHAILMRASELRRDLLHHYLAEGAQLVTGHAPLGAHTLDRYETTHSFVTVMRGPAERLASHVAFNRTPGAGHGHTALTATRFLETPRARVMGALYVKYLAGLPMDADFSAPAAIDAAKRTVDRLALIGFTDAMDRFAERLGTLTGAALTVGHANKGTADVALPSAVTDRIEELCAPDKAVYAHARARFGERRSSARA